MSKIKLTDLKGKMINMHTHTARCMHAKGEDREYVEKAIESFTSQSTESVMLKIRAAFL